MARLNCKSKQICIGNLSYRIELQKRDLTPPADIDFKEQYTKIADVWAHVEIAKFVNSALRIFDKTNIDQNYSHSFFIRYRDDVDINNWILYDEQRYKIISVTTTDFDKNFLELRCNLRGSSTQESSKW